MSYMIFYRYTGADISNSNFHGTFDWVCFNQLNSAVDAYQMFLECELNPSHRKTVYELRHNFKIFDIFEIDSVLKDKIITKYFSGGGSKQNYEDFIREFDLERRATA